MKNNKRRINAFFTASVMLVIALFSLTLVACKTPDEQSYKITYATENALYGTVSGTCESGEDVKKGTSITLTATPENEYAFTGWFAENTLKSNDNPYTFSVSEEISLTAKFEFVGHVCAFNEHVSYSIDEYDVIYRTMKCSCGETQTTEFTNYVSVVDTYNLMQALVSTGVENRLVVLESGWTYSFLELGLNHLDKGITIIGKEGVTMNGLTINSGKGESGENRANALTDIMASGVTIMGIEFTKDLQVYNCSMDKLTIRDCHFTDGAGINIRANSWTGTDEVNARPLDQRNTISNTTIEGCTFERFANVTNKSKIYLFDIDGATIRNNNISSCEYNAMQLNSRSNGGVWGDIVIEGNTISDVYSRAIRITNIMGNITVKDNTFSYIDTSGKDNGQIFKANSQSATTVITFTGNKLNGSLIEVNDPKVVWEHSVLDN